ncbi:MAG: hypothetical protein II336_08835 [Loktanella sp.]|nr:hypothetical protein [Loktanella sp.]
MPKPIPRTEADRAARAFYGQQDRDFADQIAQICGDDPRLIQAFQQTRDRFLETESTVKASDMPARRLC